MMDTDKSAILPLVLATVLAALSSAAAGWLAGAIGAALAAPFGVLLGYAIGRHWGAFPSRVRLSLLRVADELAQYRAFTRLMRDQGDRITETTGDAAQTIAAGLHEIDTKVASLIERIDTEMPGPDGEVFKHMAVSIGEPIVGMFGKLQFQDVTRQQLAFLARLSHVLDEHMVALAQQMGDRRALDRVGQFKQMFDQALNDCVMSSQRDDHHAASGTDFKEAVGPKVELF